MDWLYPSIFDHIPETRIEVLEEAKQDLEKRIKDKDEEVLLYVRRLYQEEEKVDTLQRDRDHWERRWHASQKRATELQDECASLWQRWHASQKRATELQDECASLWQRLYQEEEKVLTLQRRRDYWERRSVTSEKKATELKDKCASLKQRLSQVEKESKQLQQKLNNCEGRVEQEMNNAYKLQNQRDQWEKRCTQQEENTKGVAEQYQEMKNRTKQEEEKVKVLQKHCEEWKHRSLAFEKRSKQFEEECKQSRQRYADLRNNYNDYVKNMEDELEQMENQLFEKDNELRKLGEELKIKTQRLASTYERRLKIRQVNVENTTQLNSPSEVEKDFRDFLDDQRTEAWDVIENSLFPAHTDDNDVKIRYLACVIFVAAYEHMEQTREDAKDFFNNISRRLIDEAPRRSQELCVRRMEDGCFTQFPVTFNISVEHQEWEDNKDVLDDLMLSLKQSAHSCDLKCFEEDVRQMVLKRWKKCLQKEKEMTLLLPPFPDKPEDVLTKLGDYIKDAIRLSWRMVTQAPPLGLEYSQLKFNQKYHTLTSLQNNNGSSKQGQYESIVYLWPGLKENEGRVIFPGEVLCI